MENPNALSNEVFNVADESNVFFIVMVCTQYRPIIGHYYQIEGYFVVLKIEQSRC